MPGEKLNEINHLQRHLTYVCGPSIIAVLNRDGDSPPGTEYHMITGPPSHQPLTRNL